MSEVIEWFRMFPAVVIEFFVTIFNVVTENPVATVLVSAIIAAIVWRVEVAQKKVDAILASVEKEEK